MIASPSDVDDERKIVREVIHDWNSAHSQIEGIVLLPVAWDTDSRPQMGDRPQGILNSQILRDADVLVAIFGSRIGTHTGCAVSGTVEEIREHHAAGKLTMIYFRSGSTPPNADQEQLASLSAFRAECQGWGLVQTFADPESLRREVTRQLATHINHHPQFLTARSQDSGATAMEVSAVDPTTLSNDAKRLLAEACDDAHGRVSVIATQRGFSLATNGHEFIEDQSPRTRARWERAVGELIDAGYIQDRSGSGEVYYVTDGGFQAENDMGLIP